MIRVREIKYSIVAVMFVILMAGSAGAAPAEERNKTFGETYTDYGKSVSQISDDDYVIAYLANSYVSGNANAWMIKVSDEAGGGDIYDCTNLGTPGTYVLSKNIMNSSTSLCISITSNDVVFDGAGYTIDGQDTFNTIGVKATTLTNVTVKNLKITDWYIGIDMINVRNGSINNNTVSSNDYFECLSTDCRKIYGAKGIQLSGSSNNIFNNNIYSNTEGLLLSSTSNNNIENNRVLLNNWTGIGLYGSLNNNIENNSIENNSNGISLGRQICGENATYSSNNIITGNTIKSNNWNGIVFDYSSNNSINNNVILKNQIMLISSINNIFYHNDFINNNKHIYDNLSINSWDSGYPSGGNFWSDYTGADNFSGANQSLLGSDGIGDTPYNISGGAGAQDRYPFIRMNGWLQEELKGDVNRNGKRDTGDATLCLRYIVGLPVPPQYLPLNCDMNCNSRIDTGDATLILRDVVSLPIPGC